MNIETIIDTREYLLTLQKSRLLKDLKELLDSYDHMVFLTRLLRELFDASYEDLNPYERTTIDRIIKEMNTNYELD
jgi:GTP cyclohydrolase III